MSKKKVVEKTKKAAEATAKESITAIQLAAKALEESVATEIELALRDPLQQLLDRVAEAQQQGLSEETILESLEGVWPFSQNPRDG